MARRIYDPRYKKYRIAVYSVFLLVMGWIMVSMIVSVIAYVIEKQ